MEVNYKNIGIRIRKIRNAKGMTQEELAEKCNLSAVYIGYIENAKRQIGLAALVKIAYVLDIGLDYLIGNQNFTLNDMMLTECSEFQRQVIFSIVKSVKEILSESDL